MTTISHKKVSNNRNILFFIKQFAIVTIAVALASVKQFAIITKVIASAFVISFGIIAADINFKKAASNIIITLDKKIDELVTEKIIPIFNKIRAFFIVEDRKTNEKINENFPNNEYFLPNNKSNFVISVNDPSILASTPNLGKDNNPSNVKTLSEDDKVLLNPESYSPDYINRILDRREKDSTCNVDNEKIIKEILNNSESHNPTYLNNLINELLDKNHSTNTGKSF